MTHVQMEHCEQVSPEQVESVAHQSGRPLTHLAASECPLCDYSAVLRCRGYTDDEVAHVRAEKLGRHLGRHLEQLALFVLPPTDLAYVHEAVSEAGSLEHRESNPDEAENEPTVQILSEPDLVHKLFVEADLQLTPPGILSDLLDLAMRWQPPQDFTPPNEYFDTEDADLLPLRQESIFGGDLHTAGWARGFGARKEGYCARCPVGHWVNIPDGSYGFRLTYFHGVPDSGVPLPRPSTIQPVQGLFGVWEGFCEACGKMEGLEKDKARMELVSALAAGKDPVLYTHNINTHQHRQEHADIVRSRTEAVRGGTAPQNVHIHTSRVSVSNEPSLANDLEELDRMLGSKPELISNDAFIDRQLANFAKEDMPRAMETLLLRLKATQSVNEMSILANSRSADGESLLMISAAQSQDRVVKLLLDLGADPNATGPGDQTALDLATGRGNFLMARQLVNGGADTSRSYVFQKIFSSDREYAGEMTRVLKEVAPLSQVNPSALSAFSRAAFEGDFASVRTFLGSEGGGPSSCDTEEGSELEVLDEDAVLTEESETRPQQQRIGRAYKVGWTPLMVACQMGHLEVVTMLMNAGANPAPKSPLFKTALEIAKENGRVDVVEYLGRRLKAR
ncbi:uncharacterized protein A1O5_06795 [Cladophialophora psammophila CBS 110553]|uniref:Uncharacterized protein n=1 Tax=Cladophialophora psammophila CBS 110553 TaxID=1182543 RepID=W9XH84_9EURO|nr:uncharacterized protein A1O5_06795 [Cladophialophora psammophila CBS 110553]EXJ69724.1 hypothetical protein A1O5_06795 [Cladophialophora psammophila CBS 110553]